MTEIHFLCGLLLNLFLCYFLRQTLWRKIFLGNGSTVAGASTVPRSNCQLRPTFTSLARKMCLLEVAGLPQSTYWDRDELQGVYLPEIGNCHSVGVTFIRRRPFHVFAFALKSIVTFENEEIIRNFHKIRTR